MEKMKLEVGKKYICRDRPDVKYVRIDSIKEDPDNFDVECLGVFFYKDGSSKISSYRYTDYGYAWIRVDERSNDLIAEYKDTQLNLIAEYKDTQLKLGPEHVGKKVKLKNGSITLIIMYDANFSTIRSIFDSFDQNGRSTISSEKDIIEILD